MPRSPYRIDNAATGFAAIAVALSLTGCTGQIADPASSGVASPPRPSATRSVRLSAAATFAGPCFDPRGRIDCGDDDALNPSEIKTIMDAVGVVSSAYSSVQTAQDIIQKLGEMVGFLQHQPKGDELILNLKSHLDQTARGVEWLIDAQFAANRYADEYGALLDAKQARDRGQPFDTSWSGWHDSLTAVISGGNKDIFRRTYSDDSVTGKWMEIIDERARVDENGLSYDWRMGLPALMQLIALRLQVIAAVDPDFRHEVIAGTGTVSPFAEEINNMRGMLMTHYLLIKDGIQCGRRALDDGVGNRMFTACADVNTGIEVVSPAGADVNELQTRLESLLHLFEIKALVNSLAMYTDTSLKDLTVATPRIRNDLDFRCLQATLVSDGSSVTSPVGCDEPRTSWSYDRETSVIRGGWTFDHCLFGDAGEGTFVATAFADTACGHDQPGGHWTYDPINRFLMNGWGYYLRWGTMQSCDDFTGECTTVDTAIDSRNPGEWGSED